MSEALTPQSIDAVDPIVRPHLQRFASVLEQAWGALGNIRTASPGEISRAGSSSRGMLVSDFTCEPAHTVFKNVSGVTVDDRYRRPWVSLAGGSVQVRFRKLTPSLTVCRSDSDRAVALSYHMGDPYLPVMEPATVLTAGYVLDASELAIERMALVCHFGNEVHYSIPLPGGVSVVPSVPQLPLVPLSEPLIRSARTAVTRRRVEGDGA